jgi:hypothetical protein
MVTAMMNKMLATVMAVAVCGALTAHAAQGAKVTVSSIFTEAPHIAVRATTTPDAPTAAPATPAPATPAASHPAVPAKPVTMVTPTPTCPPASMAASIRQAYQRDYAALEQLKQLGSSLRGTVRVQFTNVIATDEASALSLQNTALAAQATCRPVDQNGTIAQIDSLVGQARSAYDRSKQESDATGGDSGNGGGSGD